MYGLDGQEAQAQLARELALKDQTIARLGKLINEQDQIIQLSALSMKQLSSSLEASSKILQIYVDTLHQAVKKTQSLKKHVE